MLNIDDRLIKEDLKEIGAASFVVLCCLCSFINAKRVCYPKLSTLMLMTGFGRDKVQNAIKNLEARNLLKRYQPKDVKNGKFDKTYYTVMTDLVQVYVPAKGSIIGVYPLTDFQSTDIPLTDLPSTVNQSTISIKKDISINKNNKESESLEKFKLFHSKYQGTKRGASTEFQNLKKKYPKEYKSILDILLPALTKQIKDRSILRATEKFVPQWCNLSTYINQRRWEEQLISNEQAQDNYKPKFFTAKSQL